jgi:hypothetical protein
MANKPQIINQTTTTSNVPAFMEPYVAKYMGEASLLTDINKNPWKQYEGQRFSNINPLQQQYYTAANNLGPSENFNAANNLTGIAALGGLNPGQFGNEQAQQYMSPYMQNVLDVQKNEAMRDYGRQMPQMGANAARMGGLGGTRAALAQSEGMRNLQQQMQGIQAKGMQDAYTNAQSQYNTDQARRMAGYGLTMQGAAQLGTLGESEFNQKMNAAGQDLSGQEQKRLDAQYQDFIDQQNLPFKYMSFMSDLARGNPATDSTSTMYGRGANNAGSNTTSAAGLLALLMGKGG